MTDDHATDRRERRGVPPAGPRVARPTTCRPSSRPRAATAGYDSRRGGLGVDHDRELQRMLCDGGFAGICFPKEYGGQGLTPEHQHAFTEEVARLRDAGLAADVPTFGDPARRRSSTSAPRSRSSAHLPAILRGEELLGAVPVRAERRLRPRRRHHPGRPRRRRVRPQRLEDLEHGRLLLATTRCAWPAPTGTCPSTAASRCSSSRSTSPASRCDRIKLVNGSTEFCQEFFDDVASRPPTSSARSTTAGRSRRGCSFHERNAVGGGSPYATVPKASGSAGGSQPAQRLAAHAHRPRAPHAPGHEHQGARADRRDPHDQQGAGAPDRARWSPACGPSSCPASSGAIIRLYPARPRRTGRARPSRSPGRRPSTTRRHRRQQADRRPVPVPAGRSLGGGSTEISRNIISERILNMPREYAADRDVPFNQVKQGK